MPSPLRSVSHRVLFILAAAAVCFFNDWRSLSGGLGGGRLFSVQDRVGEFETVWWDWCGGSRNMQHTLQNLQQEIGTVGTGNAGDNVCEAMLTYVLR